MTANKETIRTALQNDVTDDDVREAVETLQSLADEIDMVSKVIFRRDVFDRHLQTLIKAATRKEPEVVTVGELWQWFEDGGDIYKLRNRYPNGVKIVGQE